MSVTCIILVSQCRSDTVCIFPNIKIKCYKLHATVHSAIPRYYPYFSEACGQQQTAVIIVMQSLGFFFHRDKQSYFYFKKTLAHNRKIENNLAMITVL